MIEDLWPKSIDVRILSPLTILRSQAAFIEKRTGGLLAGHISTDSSPDKVSHSFSLIANAPHRVLISVLVASHSTKEVYPVEVVSRAFEPKPPTTPQQMGEPFIAKQPDRRTAVTQEAFVAIVKEVLNSEPILASVNSIIAMSNEADQERSNSQTVPPSVQG